MVDHIVERDGYFYFWDQYFEYCYGPYETEKSARIAFRKYLEEAGK